MTTGQEAPGGATDGVYRHPTKGRRLTVTEVARAMHVTPASVRTWISEGHLPGHRVGPRNLYVWESDARAIAGGVLDESVLP